MSQPTVLWEITRSCALKCIHCDHGESSNGTKSEELSTYEAYKTIDQIVALRPAEFIITGGDPLARPDLDQVIDYARRRGLEPAVALSPSPNLTSEWLTKLRDSGARKVIFAINGSTSHRHDLLTAVRGSFDLTMTAINLARAAGLTIEIDTLITRRNFSEIEAIADLVDLIEATAWNVHFLVPVGPSRKLEILSAAEAERAFAALAAVQSAKRFRVRTVEAPEYRRYLIQNREDQQQWADLDADVPADIADCTVDDIVFISATGAVRPSEFLPLAAGNVRYRPLFGIVRGSDLFVAFRDRSNLNGKCSRCEFREVCGGSRARAWAMTGLLFGTDPLCIYNPPLSEAQEMTAHATR
jgi:radical SAM protein with 4Fe4S-binding SPASM domain